MNDALSVRDEKARLRQRMRADRAQLTGDECEAAMREAARFLLAWPPLSAWAGAVLYSPVRGEMQVHELWRGLRRAGVRVALPRVLCRKPAVMEAAWVDQGPQTLIPGAFGILEPPEGAPSVNEPVAVVVPGLAFDRCGRRLGSGHGFYDRFLRQCHGVSVGLGYERQIVARVPEEPHDWRVQAVASEAGVSWIASLDDILTER